MNAQMTDTLAKHDSAIAKQFADQGKKSASKFNVLKTLMGARFDDFETAQNQSRHPGIQVDISTPRKPP